MSKEHDHVQVNMPGESIDSNGEMDLTREDGMSSWHPLQFHFHSPSEHTINGQHMDLEMHMVHLTEDGGLGAVLAILFDAEEGGDGENLFLD
jgi:carbonic anhydrase